MTPEQLERDVAKAIRIRDTTDEFAMARAALAVAIEAAAKTIEDWPTLDVWRSDGAAGIRALLPARKEGRD